jgi:signal peptidase I
MGAIVEKGGSGIQSVRITRGGIPFNANSNVSITFSLSSDVNRNVQMAVIDGNTNAVLASGSMNASYEPHDHELTFKTSRYTDNAYVDFYIGNDGSGTTAEYHTVSVENFRIVSSNPVVSGISIDQVGYQTVGQKRCTFAYDAGDMFDVVDTQGWPVYTGAIIGKQNDVIVMDSESGNLQVNGTTQTGEIMYPTYAKDGIEYPYRVPEGTLFLLGDYRTQAEDSRDFGPVPLNKIQGKVITIVRRRGV